MWQGTNRGGYSRFLFLSELVLIWLLKSHWSDYHYCGCTSLYSLWSKCSRQDSGLSQPFRSKTHQVTNLNCFNSLNQCSFPWIFQVSSLPFNPLLFSQVLVCFTTSNVALQAGSTLEKKSFYGSSARCDWVDFTGPTHWISEMRVLTLQAAPTATSCCCCCTLAATHK